MAGEVRVTLVVWCDVMNVMLQALAGEVLHLWCGVIVLYQGIYLCINEAQR